MRVIIAGGRDFNKYGLLKRKCNNILQNREDIEIVSGKQKTVDKDGNEYGADFLGEKYAKEKGYKVTPFPADWKNNGKAAGFMRNEQMAEYADCLIAFWDGKSRGTADMIERAKSHGLKIRVIKY
jgi:hypothetical protein